MSNEAYNRSGWGKLSDLAGGSRYFTGTSREVFRPPVDGESKPRLFDDPIVEEVIDSLRREILMLERRLAAMEE